MCAINGITKNDQALVVRMNNMTSHRGPDGTDVWEGDGVTLGHNRLAIIDLTENGHQPIHDPSGRYTIVFNGEIYNYRELKSELASAYVFRTESDTEVLLASWIVWGKDMFAKLRGIFACAIWDSHMRTLTLVRDHMGVKPLYYAQVNGAFVFSSELTALLSILPSPTLNQESVGFYLTMEYVPSSRTLLNSVQKLRPGTILTYREGVCEETSFLSAPIREGYVSEEMLYTTIDAAVKRQLVSDRQVGAYLSGGFDSSIVVHHMTQHTQHTRTYSVDFESVKGEEEDSHKFNMDAALAQKTAAFFGTEHKPLTITLSDVRASLEEVLSGVSEPIANSTSLTQFLLSDHVRKDGTVVVLGGDGGDELFGGYTRHRLFMGAYLYQRLPYMLQKLGGKIHPRVQKLMTPLGSAIHRTLMVKDEKKIAPFLQTPLGINKTVQTFFNDAYGMTIQQGIHPLHTFMEVDRQTWLPDECFLRSDYASMAHGVELRVPFVDLDVVALSDRISPWKKTWPHEGKRIIRHAYRSYLPSHLYHEPKRGWLSPAAKWFRDPVINAYVREVFSSKYYSGLDGLFDWDKVQMLLNDHVEKRGYYLYPLWNILALQVWARKRRVVYEAV